MPQKKPSKKNPLLIVGIVGTGFSLIILLFLVLDLSTQDSYAKSASRASVPASPNLHVTRNLTEDSYGLPARIRIPKISVDTTITHMGLTSDGAMDIPKTPDDVAWYELGPRPGDIGSAVIAGHYGRWKNGQGSVFDDLNQLSVGDSLSIEDEKGTIITFVVREIRSYDPNADASDVFFSQDGRSHLNLITCEGVWNKTSKSYSKRLVIFTDQE